MSENQLKVEFLKFLWLMPDLILGPAAAAKSLQLCPTLCDPIDGSSPGSSAHGFFLARILEWSYFLLQGMLPTQGSNLCLLNLLHWQAGSPNCMLYQTFAFGFWWMLLYTIMHNEIFWLTAFIMNSFTTSLVCPDLLNSAAYECLIPFLYLAIQH